MSKFRWNPRWILFLLSPVGTLMILGLNPAKSQANPPEYAASTVRSGTLATAPRQLSASVVSSTLRSGTLATAPKQSSGSFISSTVKSATISSTVGSTTVTPAPERSSASLSQGSNSAMNRVTPDKQVLSPVPERSPVATPADLALGSDSAMSTDDAAMSQTTPADPALSSDLDMSTEDDDAAMSQVTSVSQLSDVKPSDWAFQALQSLVERYGVIAGYPDRTFRGNRAMTRYEFAAGLNAALSRIDQLLAAGTSDVVRKEDLDTLQKLQNQFAQELANLRGRVDGLDVRVATLQQHQFSTTTIFTGEVETVIGAVAAGNNVITRKPAPRTITFQDRLRVEFNTSFTGKDQLRLQLGAGNIEALGGVRNGVFGTNDGKTSDNRSAAYAPNQLNLGGARYRFPLGPNTTANIFAQSDGAFALGLTVPINPFFEGSAANGISRYSRRNMVYDYGDTGAGVAVLHRFGKQLELGLEYTAINPNSPTPGNGEFNGRYVALGQLIYYSPGSNFRLGLTYSNTYSPRPGSGGVGSTGGQNFGPVIGSNLANSNGGRAVVANVYGIEPFYRITPKFAINGWLGYTAERFLRNRRLSGGDGKVWNWGIGLAFPDLLKKANLAGIFIGMEPRLTSLSKNVDLGAGRGQVDRNTSLHFEAFYQYQITDNIAITPGVIWITAPDFNARNPDSIVGWIRTTFRF